jgi:hypothetical protein
VKKFVAAICCLFLLPVLIAGAATGGGGAVAIDRPALKDIPTRYLSLYAEAAGRYRFDWELLAAVGKVECDHGRGDCYRPNPAGAMGPMQFMPATWRAYASASGTSPFDVYDARDAIFGAAAKLSADGIRRAPRRALFSYNHSSAYVDEVLSWAIRYGWMGGDARTLQAAVLSHPNIELRPEARADIEAGLVDERVLGALLVLARDHRLGYVGPFISAHSIYVSGTDRISNHALGRAVDIPVVDGTPVSAGNLAARSVAESLLRLPAPLRPDELGAPWRFASSSVVTFTQDHERHVHFGFSEED